ncbi:MAG TPA: protein kinase [Acidobacteriaceae bacterium]|nr:protein kinase [Acidobacteriaceae bacterium]
MNELEPGSALDHYKILRRLGAGGMGVVYEAEDLRLRRHVALKLIAAGAAADSEARERFWREARTASALNHPGICTIHEINESENQPFLVMELLEGQSLDRLYAGQTVPVPRLVEIGVQLADALDAAHRKGILHRDIKPANIFITGSGQAKILDFGLARFEESGLSDSTGVGVPSRDRITSSGATLGTIAYMSPEQARGETLDGRSDLFSLGVVLYEMATGIHPFSGTTTAVVFDKLLNYQPPPPLTVNHNLPPELESIINKALEKDRDLRYQSAADLRADLKRLQRRPSESHASAGALPGAASYSASYPGMTRVGSPATVSAQTVAVARASSAPASGSADSHSAAQATSQSAKSGRPMGLVAAVVVLGLAVAALGAVLVFHRKAAPPPPVASATPPVSNAAPAVTNPAPAGTTTPPAVQKPETKSAPKKTGKPSPNIPLNTNQPPAPRLTPAVKAVPNTAANTPAAGGSAPGDTATRHLWTTPAAFVARHLHVLGSCTGTLQLTPLVLSFHSSEHSVALTRAQIRAIEGDAVIENNGHRWRFAIPGKTEEQVHELLTRWDEATPQSR